MTPKTSKPSRLPDAPRWYSCAYCSQEWKVLGKVTLGACPSCSQKNRLGPSKSVALFSLIAGICCMFSGMSLVISDVVVLAMGQQERIPGRFLCYVGVAFLLVGLKLMMYGLDRLLAKKANLIIQEEPEKTKDEVTAEQEQIQEQEQQEMQAESSDMKQDQETMDAAKEQQHVMA